MGAFLFTSGTGRRSKQPGVLPEEGPPQHGSKPSLEMWKEEELHSPGAATVQFQFHCLVCTKLESRMYRGRETQGTEADVLDGEAVKMKAWR